MKVVRVHEDEGYRTGILVTEGPAWVHILWLDDSGVKINKVANDRHLKVSELVGYPIARAKKLLRRCGRTFGITKSAKKALRA